MSDNIEHRADAYENRLRDSGGTDALMVGLVRSIKRTRTALILTICGLALDLSLSVVLAVAVIALRHTENIVRVNTVQICEDNNKAAVQHNRLIDAIVLVVTQNPRITLGEKIIEVERLRATTAEVVHCPS